MLAGRHVTIVCIVGVLLLGLATRPARAADTLDPSQPVFSAAEVAAYEDALRERRNHAIVWAGATTVGALVATGVTLLAIGLGGDPGSSALTTMGVTTLSLATIGAFAGLELVRW